MKTKLKTIQHENCLWVKKSEYDKLKREVKRSNAANAADAADGMLIAYLLGYSDDKTEPANNNTHPPQEDDEAW